MKLIGLTGYAQSGKDTVADILVKRYGYTKRAFADPLKDATAAMLDIPRAWCDSTEGKSRIMYGDVTLREVLQRMGTEACRHAFGDDWWVSLIRRWLMLAPSLGVHGVVIPDVRFDNEAEMVRDLGGFVWRVERPGVGPLNDHASERGISDALVSHTIHNQGTIEDLDLMVVRLMPFVGGGG